MTDSRRIDRIVRSENNIREESYSDFLVNFNRHPETGNLVTSKDADAVRRSIRNLISTNKGERLFNYELGSDIRKALFENMSPITEDLIKTYITETINKYEPRCTLDDVLIESNFQNNSYSITILFTLINNTRQSVLNISLFRVR